MSIERVPVDIIGDHPHTGRRGTLEVIDGKVTTFRFLGFCPPMVRVEFENGEAAGVEGKNLRRVKPPAQRPGAR